jgi:uncharacterized protein YjbJ (UPF0337 family)
MNPDILKGRWLQVKGDIRRRWGKLTDNDVTEIEGRVEILIGKLQERYGMKREEAQKQISEFLTPSGIKKTA